MRAMSRDRNEDEDEDGVALSAANGTSFTKKLFEILQNPKNNDIIRWGHGEMSHVTLCSLFNCQMRRRSFFRSDFAKTIGDGNTAEIFSSCKISVTCEAIKFLCF